MTYSKVFGFFFPVFYCCRIRARRMVDSNSSSSFFRTEAINFTFPSPLGFGIVSGDVKAFRRTILAIFKLQHLLCRPQLGEATEEVPRSVSKTRPYVCMPPCFGSIMIFMNYPVTEGLVAESLYLSFKLMDSPRMPR